MLDPLLAGFIAATDDAEAERQLALLIDTHATPLVRAIATRKLRDYAAGGRAITEDVEDVVGESTLELVDRLTELRDSQEAAPIEAFLHYTATVAHHACAHHLRRKYPGRARLKNRLRYVLEQESAFALWHTNVSGSVCGLDQWKPAEPSPTAMDGLRRLSETSDRSLALPPEPTTGRRALTSVLAGIFRILAGPVEFDGLVGAVGRANRVDPGTVSLDASRHAAPGPAHETTIDQRRYAAWLWAEIRELPVRQRAALLLNLRDQSGEGVLWVFPIAGVASIREIAAALDLPHVDLAAIWKDLPLDDHAIAARLGCSRQQVINLRMAARKRLTNRRRAERADTAKSTGRANLRRVSTSLESDT